MGLISVAEKIAKNPEKIMYNLGKREVLNWMSDESYIRLTYFLSFRRMPDLQHPQTFNEKIQWMKLHDRNPLYTRMVDKYEAKQFVAERVGAEYTIPTLGVWDNPDEIDFSTLPEQFVLKCTHDSGSVFICKDRAKWDWNAVRKKLRRNLKRNFFWLGREWAYKDIQPRVIAEPYLEDSEDKELRDYKFFTFGGTPKFLFVATERNTGDVKFDFYDMDFRHLPFLQGHPLSKKSIDKPEQFSRMVELSAKLASGFPQLRVDFYEVDGKLYIGELTLYHFCGFVPFSPETWDKTIGDWFSLPVEVISSGGGYHNHLSVHD